MKEKWNRWLPVIFVALFAISRIPGLLPSNFSAAYAFIFCAGAFFPKKLAWWLPLGTMLATDIALTAFYYHAPLRDFIGFAAPNYVLYGMMIWLGRRCGARASFVKMLGGGMLSALVFYFVTNTLSWLQDPGYLKTIAGWIQALTIGRPDFHPTTLEMFRNTLLSTGLFTALFTSAAKVTASEESPLEKTAGAREEGEAAEAPEEAAA